MELTKLEELNILKQARELLKTNKRCSICRALDEAVFTVDCPSDYKKILLNKYFLKYKSNELRTHTDFWWPPDSPKRLEVMDLEITALEKSIKSTKEEIKTALKVIEENENKVDKLSIAHLKNILSDQLEPERKTTIIQFEYSCESELFLLENIKDYFKKNYWDGYNIKITEFSKTKQNLKPM